MQIKVVNHAARFAPSGFIPSIRIKKFMYDLSNVIHIVKSYQASERSAREIMSEMDWLLRRLATETGFLGNWDGISPLTEEQKKVMLRFIDEVKCHYPDHLAASLTFTHEEAITRGIIIYSLPDNLINQIKEKSLPLPTTETQAS